MQIKVLSLSDEGLADSRKSFKVYVTFLMNKMSKGLSITTPSGKETLRFSDKILPLFFHKGMVANLRADERAITCREALTLELHRQNLHRVANNHNRVYLTHLSGRFKPSLTSARIENLVEDFIHKRDGRAALLDTAIKADIQSSGEGEIVFPTLDTFTGDALTSPAMLVWLLRNGQSYILNTRNNYDSLNGVITRFKRFILKTGKTAYDGSRNANTHSLFMWLALFLTPEGNNRQIMAIDNAKMGNANGPVSFIEHMNFERTMQNILYRDGMINRLAQMTDNFDVNLIGQFPHYSKLKEYEKYIK